MTIKLSMKSDPKNFMDERGKLLTFLSENRGYSYTTAGLMVNVFAVNVEDLSKHFNTWSKEHQNLYKRIRRSMTHFEKTNKVIHFMTGNAIFYQFKPSENQLM